MTPHLLPARSPICRELFVPAQAISRDTAGVRVGECTAPATVDHELPCARYSAFRAPSRSFVYTACRCLGSIIIFSQIKLTRPDRVSAVARSSPKPIWSGGTALLSKSAPRPRPSAPAHRRLGRGADFESNAVPPDQIGFGDDRATAETLSG